MFKNILAVLILSISAYAAEGTINLTPEEKSYIAHKKVIKMCVDPDWVPFERINEKGEHEGIAADLVQTVASRSGLKIELLKVSNWEESLAASKAGKCEIMSFLNKTPDRDKWLIFTEPIFYDPNVFITREEHGFIADPATLTNETMALPKGTMVEERIKKDYPNIKIILTDNEDEAIELVENKRANMTMRSLIVAAYSIKKSGHFNLKISGQIPEYTNKLRIGVIKSEPILRDILNKAVMTITPQEREQISNKHVSVKVESGISKGMLFSVVAVIALLAIGIFLLWLWNYQLKKMVKIETEKSADMQNKLFQIYKEAEVGKVVAQISHQWRGPLTKIGSINMLLHMRLKNDETVDRNEMLEKVQKVEDVVEFMSQTMDDFLEFYKPEKSKEKFDVYSTILRAENILAESISALGLKIQVINNADMSLFGVKNQFVHVWMNLFDNSIKASKSNDIKSPSIAIEINKNEIIYIDNAGGMPDKTSISIHRGLGLQICSEIVAGHDGAFDYVNIQDGTKFIMKFERS